MGEGSLRQRSGLLGLLDPEDRDDLLRLGRPHRFRAGARIIVQGDHSSTVFVLLDGLVKVTIDTADGHEILLTVLGPGDLLGEFEAVDVEGVPRTANNVALQPVHCRVLSAAEFLTYLRERPLVSLLVLRRVVQRLRAADRRRTDAGFLPVSRRLARLLVELGEQYGRRDEAAVVVDLPLSQEELASVVAASRDSAVRGLRELRARRLIATGRREVTIIDFDQLRRYAE